MTISFIYSFPFPFRGAFSYVKRVTEKNGKRDYAAKFVTSRGRRKAAALREMELLSELEHERILYFHDAFEKKNVLVLITELYPSGQTWSTIFCCFHYDDPTAANKKMEEEEEEEETPQQRPHHCFYC